MKKLLYLLILGVGLYYGYQQYTARQRPPEQLKRFAPDGVYFLLEYISIKTPTGMVGVIPGQEVHEVRKAVPPPGRLRVSEGKLEFEVDRAQLTNDLDLADAIQKQDLDGQRRLAALHSEQERKAALAQAQLESARAEDVDRMNQTKISASAIGKLKTRLNESASAVASSAGGATSYTDASFNMATPTPSGTKYKRDN